ncbi:MAG: hypothetical protein HY815_03705 [Candidatus Riflebacteria bacterium]|nr:hypothetical protein [Candidatus Riflebacteria bacterium]
MIISPNHRRSTSAVFIAAMTMFASLLAPAAGAGEPIVVVVNPGSPVDEVTSAVLKDIYLGKEGSIGGSPAAPANYKSNTPIRNAFEKQMMGTDPEDVNKHWKSQKFLGFGDNQPVIMGSPEAIKKFVARQKGAIGYVPLSLVDGTVHLVKRVNGRDVTNAAGYPYQAP